MILSTASSAAAFSSSSNVIFLRNFFSFSISSLFSASAFSNFFFQSVSGSDEFSSNDCAGRQPTARPTSPSVSVHHASLVDLQLRCSWRRFPKASELMLNLGLAVDSLVDPLHEQATLQATEVVFPAVVRRT